MPRALVASCHLPFGWDGEEVLRSWDSLSSQPGMLLQQVWKAERAQRSLGGAVGSVTELEQDWLAKAVPAAFVRLPGKKGVGQALQC